MAVFTKRQSGQAWENVPALQGSRWGFIGLMIGIAVLLLVLICIIFCLCRKKRNKNRMKKASKGDALLTSHPAPDTATKRPPEPRIKPTPAPQPPQAQYMLDEEEGGSIYDHHNGGTPYAAAMAADKRRGSQPQMHQVSPGDYGYHTPIHNQPQYQQQQPYDGYDYGSQYGHDQQQYGAMAAPAPIAHSNSQYGYEGNGASGYGYDNQHLPPGAAQPHFSDNSRYFSPTPTSPMGTASPGGCALPTPYVPPQQSPHLGAYPQDNYAASGSQPAAAASLQGGYDEGYSPHAAVADEPPAYPQDGAQHTHDEAKTSFGPRAV